MRMMPAEFRQPTEETSSAAWMSYCSTRDDPVVNDAREELVSYTQYLRNSIPHDLDDDYPNDGLDEYSEAMTNESIPSNVFVPGTLRDRIKLKGKNIRRSFRRKRSSGRTIDSSIPSSSLNRQEEHLGVIPFQGVKRNRSTGKSLNSSLPSPPVDQYKPKKVSKKSISRLDCTGGNLNDMIRDDEVTKYSLRSRLSGGKWRRSRSAPSLMTHDDDSLLAGNGTMREPFQIVPINTGPDIEVVPEPRFCGIMDTFCCRGQQVLPHAPAAEADQLCFGVGGDRLLCQDSISEDGSSSDVLSTGSFELPSVGVFEEGPQENEVIRTPSFPGRISQRIRRVRSAAPKLYLI